jgi:hypothetical protein
LAEARDRIRGAEEELRNPGLAPERRAEVTKELAVAEADRKKLLAPTVPRSAAVREADALLRDS